MAKQTPREARLGRHTRVRQNLSGVADRPRLCVFRSLNAIYAQLIDDVSGRTLVAASTLDAEAKTGLGGKKKIEQAGVVGTLLAKRAQDSGIKSVVFDRGGYLYHGRVKALAEAARRGGLKF